VLRWRYLYFLALAFYHLCYLTGVQYTLIGIFDLLHCKNFDYFALLSNSLSYLAPLLFSILDLLRCNKTLRFGACDELNFQFGNFDMLHCKKLF